MNEINVIENTNELLFKSNIKYDYKYNKDSLGIIIKRIINKDKCYY